MQHASGGHARRAPAAAAAAVTAPAVWLLGHATNVAVRLMGGDPARHRDEITPAELRDLVSRTAASRPSSG